MERIRPTKQNDVIHGRVKLSLEKLIWCGGIFVVSIVGGVFTYSVDAVAVFVVSTAITLCFGHSLGMHRKLIHNAYECPKWLEYLFVHLGVLVGLAGPFGMIKTHDMRDWAQRQVNCHDFFAHRQAFVKDAYWQLFCDIHLENPPEIKIEPAIAKDKVYQWMEKHWMLQQLPLCVLLFLCGGVNWVIWGGFMRVSVSILGHWLVGYFAHNDGQRSWHVEGASVQGFNIPIAAILTMGESWHNNHHAFPGSARIGLKDNEIDLGWNVLLVLRKLGLVWNIVLPEDLPDRKELTTLSKGEKAKESR